MVTPLTVLAADQVAAAIRAVAPGETDPDPQIRASEHADLQANGAFPIARRAGRQPQELAAAIAGALPTDGVVARCEVAGPGFLNLTLDDTALLTQVRRRLADPRLGVHQLERGITTVIDYSNPNIAKHMHVGHLRSTVIGDALVRVLEHLGGRVIRQNHVGDWGTQFGMLIQHLREDPGQPGTGGRSFDELGERYRAATAAFTADPDFAERARQRVVALQQGDPATVATWRELVAESSRYFADVYERLDVRLTAEDTVGESYFNPHLSGVLDELVNAGVAELSDGAWCVFLPGETGRDSTPLPLIVRKRDGGFGYAATDLAALRHRVHHLGADRVLYVVDARQTQHLRMVFAAAARAGWLSAGVAVEHLPFGTVLDASGRPLKTRDGHTPRLVDLVDQAVSRAWAVVAEKNPNLAPAALTRRAEQVGVGAIKYADLSTSRGRDYTFDLDRMVSLTGNTGVYLQYAHARIRAILRRAGDADAADPDTDPDTADPDTAGVDGSAREAAAGPPPAGPLTGAERRLARHLDNFAPVVEQVAETREPHRLCAYLYTLAQAFTAFYEECPVLTVPPPQRDIRLALCRLTGRTLRTGLDLLGIAAPERL